MRPFSEKTSRSKGRKWRGSIKETKPGAKRNLTPPPPGQLPQATRSNRAHKAGLTLERSSAGRIDMLTCGGLARGEPLQAARGPADIPGWAEAFADRRICPTFPAAVAGGRCTARFSAASAPPRG